MSSFYGYGVDGKLDDPFYAMQKSDIGLTPQSFADYSGLYFTITFLPGLLLGGPIIQNMSKTNALGWCMFIWGACSAAHGLVTEMWMI